MTNIASTKGNQSMKFGQLIEYNRRNIFLERTFTKYGGETSSQTLSQKITIEHISGSTAWIYIVCFYCMPSWKLSRYIEAELLTTSHLLLPCIKLFLKIKRVLQLLPHFLHDFWIKVFLLLYSITWSNFIVWFSLLREILGNMCIVIVC